MNKKRNITEYICPVIGPLWWRIWKDYWFIMLACGSALFSFHWLFVSFLPLYGKKYRIINTMRHLPKFVRSMIGEDLISITSTTSLGAFAYLHPITLTLLMAFALMLPSWVITAQIDKGTIDIILSTPRSRNKYMLTTILAGITGGAILIGMTLLGTYIGVKRTILPEPYNLHRISICALNLYMLYLVLLGFATFLSAISSIRSWAIGWGLGISVFCYMLHFFSEWWQWIKRFSKYGPLNYFHPIKIATGYNPSHDIIVLGIVSLCFFIAAMIWFAKRDIVVI